MSKKGRHASHADERWLLTYADMITLLMALFIVMFAISAVNKGKFDQLAASLKKSFSGDVMSGDPSVLNNGSPNFNVESASSPSNATPDPVPEASSATAPSTSTSRAAMQSAVANQARQDAQLAAAKSLVDQKVSELKMQDKVMTQIDERGLVIRLVTDDVVFDTGSADVRPAADPLLRVVAKAIEPIPLPIHVEGHTDSKPFVGDPEGNFKLSVDRGRNVAVFLLENGVDPTQHAGDVTGTGYADWRPLPGLAASDPKNRRVEIVIVRRDYVKEAQAAATGPIGSNPTAIQAPVQSGDIAPVGAG